LEPPVVHADGYIENKVNYLENISEGASNSWNEEASVSEYSEGDEILDEELE